MSDGGSELHRFGIDPDSEPDQQQWANVCKMLKALLNNPNLLVGNSNSEIIFPDPVNTSKDFNFKKVHIPFELTLVKVGAAYKVKVGWGLVCERGIGSDAITLHTPTDLNTEISITVGQAVFVKVIVDSDAAIATSGVSIVVDADATVSPSPTVSATGAYYYKLGTLTAAVAPATTPTFTKHLTGSHISHWRVLPPAEAGDILYHDGTSWVILSAPTPAATYVLSHDGTAPAWIETEECY